MAAEQKSNSNYPLEEATIGDTHAAMKAGQVTARGLVEGYCARIAATVPAGFSDDGLPIGLEIMVKPYAEPTLFRFAYAFEQATHHRHPPASTPEL